MSRPLVSVIIPTQGRPTLRRAVQSIGARHPNDYDDSVEIIVVIDAHDHSIGQWSDTPAQRASIALNGINGLTMGVCDAGYNDYGHPQCQYGMSIARGEWLAFLGDDDEWTYSARELVAAAIKQTGAGVMIFRSFMERPQRLLPTTPGVLQYTHVSAQNIVVRNEPTCLGSWDSADGMHGDWRFIESTVQKWGGIDAIDWRPEMIAVCH